MTYRYTVRAWDSRNNQYVTLDSGVDHRRVLDLLAYHLMRAGWEAGVFTITRDAAWKPEETVDLSTPTAAEADRNAG